MALRINTNISSLNSDQEVNRRTDALNKNYKKLSSGLRIDSASDDPAGLSVAVDMLTSASVEDVGMQNISDAVSAANIAEGGISNASDIVSRMGELATQAANGTLSADQRTALNNEYQSLSSELDRLGQTTEFNGQQLLSGSTSMTIQTGGDASGNSQLALSFPGVNAAGLGLTSDISTQAGAQSAIDETKKATDSLASSQGDIGGTVNRMQVAFANLQSSVVNLRDAASQIRDLDVANESANLTANQIAQQSATAVQAQANTTPQLAMKLLS